MIRRHLPSPVLQALRTLRRVWRRGLYHARRLQGKGEVTADDLLAALRELHIRPGDDMLVHSSLRGLGVVLGGADAVIHVLREAVGEAGTILVPAYPLQSTMLAHLERGGIALDVNETPSRMGQISEAVRRLPGSKRSLHPTHSVAAVGPRAGWYCGGHERSRTPCGPGSPFVKLIERQGWVVAIGSPIGKVTSYHVIEDLVESFPVPVYLDRVFTARVRDAHRQEHEIEVLCHNPEVSKCRIDNTREIEATFERLLAERGALHTELVGSGMVSAMRADLLEAALEDVLRQGITIYDVSHARHGN